VPLETVERISLLRLDEMLLGPVTLISIYAAYEDWVALTYSPASAFGMLWLGLLSITMRLVLSFSSNSFPLVFPPDMVLALAFVTLLHRLGFLAAGDVAYFSSLSFCFPYYPYRLALSLSECFRMAPQVSIGTSFAMVLLTNSFLIIPYLLSLRLVLLGRVTFLWRIFSISTLLLGLVSIDRLCFLVLPYLLLHHFRKNNGLRNEPFPMIPCFFVSSLLSLFLGDLMLFLR